MQRTIRAICTALAVVVLCSTAILTPATAAESAPSPVPSNAIREIPKITSFQYVEASSPQEAVKKLDRIEALERKSKLTKTEAKAAAAIYKSYGPCKLYVASFHNRDSHHGHGGIKSQTGCTSRISWVWHTTNLRYKQLLWWLQGGNDITHNIAGSKMKGKKIEGTYYKYTYSDFDVKYKCANGKSTLWSGSVLGNILWNNKHYYARVYAPPRHENCGHR